METPSPAGRHRIGGAVCDSPLAAKLGALNLAGMMSADTNEDAPLDGAQSSLAAVDESTRGDACTDEAAVGGQQASPVPAPGSGPARTSDDW